MIHPSYRVPDDARPARLIGITEEGDKAVFMYTDTGKGEPEFAYGEVTNLVINGLYGDPVFIDADTVYFCA